MNSEFYKLILVTHRQNSDLPEYLHFIKECITSGVTSVQLREKNTDKSIKLEFALLLKKLLSDHKIPLIINDDLELALHIDADGVHLGQSDISPLTARKRLGMDKYIGLSIETEKQLELANDYDINYVAASALFPTPNKNNIQKFWGLEGLNKLSKRTIHPIIGIGGVTQFNLPEIMEAGAQGVAVIGALHQAQTPSKMSLTLRKIIDNRSR